MEIILKKDLIGLGEEGDIKKVADGYARNFLIPKGIAVLKTSGNIKILEQNIRRIEERREKKRVESLSLSDRMKDIEVVIEAAAGDQDKLFGSVTSQEIARHLNDMGYDVDKRRVELKAPIKMLGEFSARIRLHQNIHPEIKIKVIPLGSIAKAKKEALDALAKEAAKLEAEKSAALAAKSTPHEETSLSGAEPSIDPSITQ